MKTITLVRALRTGVWVENSVKAFAHVRLYEPDTISDDVVKAMLLSLFDDEGGPPGIIYKNPAAPHMWDFISKDNLRIIEDIFLKLRPGQMVAKSVEKMAREHACDRDKGGAPYIYHTLRVAMGVLKESTETEMISYFSHDLVEDHAKDGVTLESLREIGYPDASLNTIDAMSKREGETVEEYLKRIQQDRSAPKGKKSDLRDNMDPTRLKNRGNMLPKDLERMRIYAWEYDVLEGGQAGR